MAGACAADQTSRIEGLDLAFTGMWSQSLRLGYGTFFWNSEMANDPFFDKLADISRLDDKEVGDSLQLFEKHGSVPYFYLLERPDLEKDLQERGFRLYDIQRALARKPGGKATGVRRIVEGGALEWSKVFCSAYDCAEWEAVVARTVRRTLDKIEYYLDEPGTSCVALYAQESLLGLYCLGTVPGERGKGHATSLADFAAGEASRRGLDFLVLETYERDALAGFYSRLGFEEVYRKKVYTT